MSSLTDFFIKNARKRGTDVRITGELSIQYKKTKFKTWSGNFTYESRKRLLSSLLSLVKHGYPLEISHE